MLGPASSSLAPVLTEDCFSADKDTPEPAKTLLQGGDGAGLQICLRNVAHPHQQFWKLSGTHLHLHCGRVADLNLNRPHLASNPTRFLLPYALCSSLLLLLPIAKSRVDEGPLLSPCRAEST